MNQMVNHSSGYDTVLCNGVLCISVAVVKYFVTW